MNVYGSYPQCYPQEVWIIKIPHTNEDYIDQSESRFDKNSV